MYKNKALAKDNSIVIWRVYFAYIIMIFHFLNAYGLGTSMYLATDFFFIVSGFLLAKDANERKYDSAFQMLKHKASKYFPHYIFSFLISFIVFTLIGKGPQVSAVEFVSELVFLQMTGLNLRHMINVPTWYISVLFLCSYVIYFLYKDYKKLFVQLISPCWIIVIFSWFYRNYGYLSHSSLGDEVTTGIYWNRPFLLGLSMMGIGVLSFEYLKYRHELFVKGGVEHKLLCRTIEICVLIPIPVLTIIFKYTPFDYVIVIMLSIGITFGFGNGKCRIANNKIIKYFSRLSFPLYLNHNMFRELIPYFMPEFSILALFGYLIVVTLYSMLTMFCIDSITKYYEKGRVS